MVTLYVSCEGYTEEVFIKRLMAKPFRQKGVHIRPVIVQTSVGPGGRIRRGGGSSYEKIVTDVMTLCRHTDSYVTTMYDFYKFPLIPDCILPDSCTPTESVRRMEEAFAKDIDRDNFRPNILLYEFETLLFSKPSAFALCGMSPEGVRELVNLRKQFLPEEIDGGEKTAPSKRIKHIYPGYQKPTDGATVALDIGLDTMCKECPHFGEWIEWVRTLEGKEHA
ncbi:MAG TPA: DUF4276 family protein [Methanocorpusculum sp.]|nr:DUF4276 family protein [Methanocorpusculum sp.]